MIKKIFILLLCCCYLVGCGVGNDIADDNDKPSDNEETIFNVEDNTKRPWYKAGTCSYLKDNPYFLFIFIDDNESSWTKEKVDEYWNSRVKVALGYLENKAKEYDVDLKLEKGLYFTKEKEEMTVKYDGVIVDDLMEKPISRDIFEQAAKSLGFSSEKALHDHVKEDTGNQQVAICFVVNKPGRSYSMNQSQSDDQNFIEYCVLYDEWLDYFGKCYPSSVAHEILHLFGAEDYYNPYGDYPKRCELANQLYPNDIMMVALEDIYDIEFGAFTAYTVGWLDAIPKECDVDDWWK